MTEMRFEGATLRYYRKQRGMTQTALAEQMEVSFQTISGWETGASIPDLNNFCRLTDVLGISADDLLTVKKDEPPKALIGIDGGGTKTAFVLFTPMGEVLESIKLEGSNPALVGIPAACETLAKGIDFCMQKGIPVDGIFAGLAGEQQEALLSFLKKRYPRTASYIDSDAINILSSGDGNIALICGTGSIVVAREGEDRHLLGGWGYLLGDPGSAYNISRDAIRAAIRMQDNPKEPTMLLPLLCERMGWPSDTLIRHKLSIFHEKGASFVASLSPIVFSAAALGDKAALKILDEEMCGIADTINTAQSLYDCGRKVVAGGGVLEHNKEVLLPLLDRYVLPGTQFIFPDLPPVYGACVECCNRLHLIRPDSFYHTFKRTYERKNQSGSTND